jgi:small subunit ribosomal protein S6
MAFSMTRTYEVVFVAAPALSEEDLAALVEQFKKSVESKKGKVVKVESWGKRSLAYAIKKFKEGYYTVLTLEDTGEAVAELERRFRVTDSVIRFLSVRVDEDWKRQQKLKAQREKKKARRGKTRGQPRPAAPEIEAAAME